MHTPEMRVALCQLLGISLPMKADICDCKKPLTFNHGTHCKCHGGTITRHDGVKDVFGDMCRAARLSYEIEPRQCLSGNKLRPDILVNFGKDGHHVAFDITIDNPVRDAQAVSTSIRDEQKFLRQHAQAKINKYHELCEKQDISFTPIVLSAYGGILEESYSSGIKFFIRKIKRSQFVPPNSAAPTVKTYWLQRISIALWKGNAKQLGHFLAKKPQGMCREHLTH